MKKRANFVIDLLILLLAAILCVCMLMLWQKWRQEKGEEAAYAELRARVALQQPAGPAAELAEQPDVPPAEKHGSMDFEPLLEVNPQAAAWIRCEGTAIDYPVVQGTDNTYYLRHLIDGTWGRLGTIFIDSKNTPGFQDDNTILYGHHMLEGTMFAAVDRYKKQAYYDEHPTMTLYTPECDYELQLFAGYVTKGTTQLPLKFATKEEFQAFIDQAVNRSTFKSSAVPTTGDRLVTLATCDYDFSNARYVLFGILKEM